MRWLLFVHIAVLPFARAEEPAPLPKDMSALVARMKTCGKIWEKEPQPSRVPKPGEADRLEKFRNDIAKNHCNTLVRDLAAMRKKYSDNEDIVRLCDRFLVDPKAAASKLARDGAAGADDGDDD